MTGSAAAFEGLTVLERGWLSSNNILLHGAPGEGATLVDSSHCNHAAQTVALVRSALHDGERLNAVVNTHLHSDHCGGNAALQAAFGARIVIPPGQAGAVAAWDTAALGYATTNQRIARYAADALLAPGSELVVGTRRWQVLAAPGHDPHGVMLFDAEGGLLISADALWGNGFGLVFPELDGEAAFDDVAAVLELIGELPVRWVIPGHGAPFDDVAAALERARSRLQGWRAMPDRHARHAARVLIKYHAMEVQAETLAAWRAWSDATPVLHTLHRRFGAAEPYRDWSDAVLRSLVESGALSLGDDEVVRDR